MLPNPTAKEQPGDYLPLGDLGRTFQLEGALRWHVPAALESEGVPGPRSLAARVVAAAGSLFVTGLGDARVRDLRYQKTGAPLLLLEGVRDRTTAQRLVNAEVWLNPALLPSELATELEEALAEPSEEEALVGLEVRLAGTLVGTVEDADLSGPNAIVVVALAAGGTCLLPLAAPYVEVTREPAIELTDPPLGLLDAR
ncbi:MAG: hypothetical protein ROY82_09435 [Truepera sp.]|jgi:ribosomal 30S subunit maturation factor RimM|nr:hypothetical protein [Truepera sp.]